MIYTGIINVSGYDYLIKTKDERTYHMNLEFYHIKKKPKVGDIIYFPEKLLIDNSVYSFGRINDLNVLESNIDEFIKIIIDNQEIYLQRYYG